VEYEPRGPGAEACLPGFLHGPISFSAAQARSEGRGRGAQRRAAGP